MALEDLTEEQRVRLQSAIEARAAKRSGPRAYSSMPVAPPRVSIAEYQRRLSEEIESDRKVAGDLRRQTINGFMEQWKQRVDPRWADASSSDPKILERVKRLSTHSGLHKTSLVCAGEYGVGKTWNAYAYAAEVLKEGALAPQQIVDISEVSIVNIASGGYEAEKRLERLLNPRHRFFIFDDVGQATFHTAEERMGVWYEIINHVYTKQLTLVLTTNLSLRIPRDPQGNFYRDRETQQEITQSPLEIWLGPAAFDRLAHIVGGWKDGVLVPGQENMRDEVLRTREEEYLNGKQ